MSRMEDWMRTRDRHLSEVPSWVNGGITTKEHSEGKVWVWKNEPFSFWLW